MPVTTRPHHTVEPPVRRPGAPPRRPWRHLRRRTGLWWAATLILAVATAAVVAGAVNRAEAAAARYGTTRPALVATVTIAAGEAVNERNTEVRAVPVALLPPGAVTVDGLGARASATIHEGEVVHGSRLAPAGLSATTAQLPAGSRGLAVPVGAGALPVEVGDVVDVLATSDALDPSGAPTVTVAPAALVVAVGDTAVTVAVTPEQAPRVAYAISTGLVALALVAP